MVGLGLIGGSIALALRDRAGTSPATTSTRPRIERALDDGAIDAGGFDPDAEITFVATPVLAVADQVKRALAETTGLVTDVGSVKSGIAAAIDDPRFVGGHPMAGSELDGLDGADAAMFEGAVWVLTPTPTTADSTFSQVAAVVAELGAEVVALPPDRHDQVVAVVSHVPHLTAATLMGLASDRAEEHAALLRLAAGGFRDMTRIASGPPGDLARHLRREPAGDPVRARRADRRPGSDARRRRPRRPRRAARPAAARPRGPGQPAQPGQPARASWPRCASRSPTAPVRPPRCSRWPPSWASTSPASRWSTASRATAASPSCSSTWPRPSCTAAG